MNSTETVPMQGNPAVPPAGQILTRPLRPPVVPLRAPAWRGVEKKRGATGPHYRPCTGVSEEGIGEEEEDEEQAEH